MYNDPIQMKGDLVITINHHDGTFTKSEHTNLIVTSGMKYIFSRMINTSSPVMSHMGVGSVGNIPTLLDLDLSSILGARVPLTVSTLSTGGIAYTANFAEGVIVGEMTEAGIFNGITAGSMLCRTVFPVKNLVSTDSFTIVWNITIV